MHTANTFTAARTTASHNAAAALALLDGKEIAIFAQRCVAARNRNATCRRCAQACEAGALFVSPKDGTLLAAPEKCSGCAECVHACPTGALEENRLQGGQSEGNAGALKAANKVGEDGALPQYVPCSQVEALNELASLDLANCAEVSAKTFGCISLDEKVCSRCRMCATFCPTGAISRRDAPDFFGITHTPALCVRCRCCEDICPTGALSVQSDVSLSMLVQRQEELYPMKPRDVQAGAHAAVNSLRYLLRTPQVFER